MKSLLGGIGDAFEDRNFRYYSVGSIISWLSYYIQAVAVSWEAWELTHSTEWLAIVALADAIPNIALMPIGGVIADRTNRFRLMNVSYAAATVQAALLAGAAFSGHLGIGVLTALAALHGAIHAFSIPASFGFLPRFIAKAKLPSAIAIASAYAQLGVFIGPALAGWLIKDYGTAIIFALNVVGYGIFSRRSPASGPRPTMCRQHRPANPFAPIALMAFGRSPHIPVFALSFCLCLSEARWTLRSGRWRQPLRKMISALALRDYRRSSVARASGQRSAGFGLPKAALHGRRPE